MEYRKQIDSSEELAKWYNKKYESMGDGWQTPPEEINQHLDDLGVPFDQDTMLLDVGCGAGHFLAEAQKRVHSVGIDISHQAVEFCKRRGVSNVAVYSIEDISGEPLGIYDYIVSMGSLEHIVDLDTALDNIRKLLKPDGKFYFYVPNELWKHFDQPNERTMTDGEWMDLFNKHGLFVESCKRWNDNTAFIGRADDAWRERVVWDENPASYKPPNGNKLNIGSGQRRFDTGQGWINVDCVSRPGQVPDLICDVGKEKLPYPDNSMEYVVLHQVYEHFGLGEGHGIVKEAFRVLKPEGALIVTVPNMRALAERWLTGQIDDYIYFVNMYGAYQGEDGDRHKWGYSYRGIIGDLWVAVLPFKWDSVGPVTRRDIPGADIARDYWILEIQATK